MIYRYKNMTAAGAIAVGLSQETMRKTVKSLKVIAMADARRR